MTEPKLMRCQAWMDCAYYATKQFVSPDGTRTMPICTNCSKLFRLDGWRPVAEETETPGAAQ